MTRTERRYVDEEAFDPTVFGFDTSFNKVGRGGWHEVGKDYILFGKGKTRERPRVEIYLSRNTSEFVEELFGESVDFAIDEKGRILLYAGKSRHITKHSKGRRSVALSSAYDELQEIHGRVRKVYLRPTVFAKGEAILFTPAEEVA